MDPDTLLMFSGGLDSTGAFWTLLNDSKYKHIHVHHMNLKNIEKRAYAESIAVQRICQYMRKIKDFSYTESTHAYPCFNNRFIWDSDLTAFMAGNICISLPSIKYFAIGRTADDFGRQLDIIREQNYRVFHSFQPNATRIYPVDKLTKQQIFDMLQPDLRSLVWSCRTPNYENGIPNKCNKCKTCLEFPKER